MLTWEPTKDRDDRGFDNAASEGVLTATEMMPSQRVRKSRAQSDLGTNPEKRKRLEINKKKDEP